MTVTNPYTETDRTGSFGGWDNPPTFGEIRMADAVVYAYHATGRYLLMVERGDGQGCALPGGMVEADESDLMAAGRELHEETGLKLYEIDVYWHPVVEWEDLPTRHVPDPRETRDAWAVTTPIIFHLNTKHLPAVTGGDDAKAAHWVPAPSYEALEKYVSDRGQVVFPAHVDLLHELLDA